jgi:hypothetical protein
MLITRSYPVWPAGGGAPAGFATPAIYASMALVRAVRWALAGRCQVGRFTHERFAGGEAISMLLAAVAGPRGPSGSGRATGLRLVLPASVTGFGDSA